MWGRCSMNSPPVRAVGDLGELPLLPGVLIDRLRKANERPRSPICPDRGRGTALPKAISRNTRSGRCAGVVPTWEFRRNPHASPSGRIVERLVHGPTTAGSETKSDPAVVPRTGTGKTAGIRIPTAELPMPAGRVKGELHGSSRLPGRPDAGPTFLCQRVAQPESDGSAVLTVRQYPTVWLSAAQWEGIPFRCRYRRHNRQ